jgi:hypothetical protein
MRYALRTLRRAPGFLAIAVGTLAIGIGGATAVFTVIKGSLLRALPAAADPDRLVTIERVDPTTAATASRSTAHTRATGCRESLVAARTEWRPVVT